ncbi:MAG TPA: DUF4147 domain-containing protein [Anaerolineales bacterium]
MDPHRFLTHSLQDERLVRILAAAEDAIEPGMLVREYLAEASLPAYERVYILGIGKAAEPMAYAAADALPDFSKGLIITKRILSAPRKGIVTMEAAHPIPDARSVMAGQAALGLAAALTEKDLLLCCLSGGGSALAASPRTGIGLRDIQLLTAALLAAGASVQETNTLRRHLDGFKGGGLARATKAQVLSLLLSDVVGNRMEAIASGPTAPDPTSGADALAILHKYGIPAPSNVYNVLSTRRTVEDLASSRVTNVIIGSNEIAAGAAQAQAQKEGMRAEVLRTDLQGEARLVGERLAEKLKSSAHEISRPFCLIAGGETTVTIQGDGKGGRNQELALAAVDVLSGVEDVALISLATDGDDGPTDAAGAVVTGDTARRASALGLNPRDSLKRNDSYPFFDALGDLLKPGYSGTNVNDLMFLVAL